MSKLVIHHKYLLLNVILKFNKNAQNINKNNFATNYFNNERTKI